MRSSPSRAPVLLPCWRPLAYPRTWRTWRSPRLTVPGDPPLSVEPGTPAREASSSSRSGPGPDRSGTHWRPRPNGSEVGLLGWERETPCGRRWATRCMARTCRRRSRPSRLDLAGPWVGTNRSSLVGRRCSRNVPPVPTRRLWGLRATDRGIPRPHMPVTDDAGRVTGEVTSGTFSPTLRQGIGLALLDPSVSEGDVVGVDVRGRVSTMEVVRPPFVSASPR